MKKKKLIAEEMPEFMTDINRLPLESKLLIDKSVAVADKIIKRIEELGLSQKELADRMGKTEAEISRGLAGEQNLTLKSICKFETALNFTILETTPCEELKKENELLIETKLKCNDKIMEQASRISELEREKEALKQRISEIVYLSKQKGGYHP